jgi:hypothetical protein
MTLGNLFVPDGRTKRIFFFENLHISSFRQDFKIMESNKKRRNKFVPCIEDTVYLCRILRRKPVGKRQTFTCWCILQDNIKFDIMTIIKFIPLFFFVKKYNRNISIALSLINSAIHGVFFKK